MSQTETNPKVQPTERKQEAPWSPDLVVGTAPRNPMRRTFSVLLTLAVVALAAVLVRAMWSAYMDAPWTRDGTVRAYIVTVAPEVGGNVVTLPVADNQFVHKGDLLLQIDPTNYKITSEQAEAALRQAQANAQNVDAEMEIQRAQIAASQAQVDQAQAALTFAKQQATRSQDLMQSNAGTIQSVQQTESQLRQQEAALASADAALKQAQRRIDSLNAQRSGAEASVGQAQAQLDRAKVNLERTEIRSPANGWVTNLIVRSGAYASAEKSIISIVDADSFWVDAYFEETNLTDIRVGDPAEVKLMGYSDIVHGHVDSIARAISVANAQPNGQGVATVNPIFTWVRLAQRIPVRIHIDQVPQDVILAAGMTATVQIDAPTHTKGP
ncbi:HlyD family secretion protein [Methylovirgula sp. 4M-Z18]|uniref:HlyD family secretion protein n=1 Tax=Methylovirgula sp. 4M-Z18 TaxID=2293567 RepID=UPI000E2F36AF|nr:HlyD family secretion protein [Methylovirgula sp. 4M-Z18]RFB80924.1 HlyD family secretion protein [Methylovirgula sp. 4M-Z18]